MNIKKLIPQILINYCKHLPESVLANILYGFPGKRITIIGVTGTDGKTTTVNMIYSILKAANKKVSMISTINAKVAGKEYDTGFHVTNPDQFMLQKFLAEAVAHGDEFIVLEVTSHGLDQFRTWGINFEIGVITNITHEHLDYHKNMESYILAKAKLVREARYSVLNYDDKSYDELYGLCQGKILTFGMNKEADFNPQRFPISLKIPGTYNLYNALAAVAVASILNVKKGVIQKALASFSGLEGRMQEVENKKGIRILVDFAHTPHALGQVLQYLKGITSGKLIAVFGAASERDRLKRPMMGKIASEIADIIILTNEDPRFEDANQIIQEIASGVNKNEFSENQNLFKIQDRFEAIEKAISLAKKGDTIGVFGKGHEKSMNIKGFEKPWSDRESVGLALKNAR